MKKVIKSEICKERPNAVALGAFNASLGRGKGAGVTNELNGRVFNPLEYTVSFKDTDLVSHSRIYGVGALSNKHWTDNRDRAYKSIDEAVASINTGDGNYSSKPVEISFKSEKKGYFAKDVNGELIGTERVVAKNGSYIVQSLNSTGEKLYSNRRDKYFDDNIDRYNEMIRKNK